MKKILILPVLILFGQACYSQRFDERILDPFDKISVFGNVDVQLVKGERERMVIYSDDIDFIKINSRIVDRTLKISMNSDMYGAVKKVKIILTYKELREIATSGNADIRSEEVLKGDKMVFNASSGGNMYLSLDLNTLDASVGQGSVILFEGNVNSQEVSAGSGGTYSAFELICDETIAKAHTGGIAKVYAGKILKASATTKGYIGYQGQPEKKKLNHSLGGEIVEDDK
jgi:hypothetical protein